MMYQFVCIAILAFSCIYAAPAETDSVDGQPQNATSNIVNGIAGAVSETFQENVEAIESEIESGIDTARSALQTGIKGAETGTKLGLTGPRFGAKVLNAISGRN